MTRKRCRRCKHYLPKDYHKIYCLSCKRKINKAKHEQPKIIKIAEVCDTCCKSGILQKVKKYHHLTGKAYAECIACEKCREGFLKRLGYR